MIRLVVTCDYEIFGNGTGEVSACMLRPAEKMMELCEKHGARMTFFVEVLELWTFQQTTGHTAFAKKIEAQIISMFQRGHDVQLHLHPQWLGAKFKNNCWQLNYDTWRISSLSNQPQQLLELFQSGKEYLEQLAAEAGVTDYACTAFRAGAWSIQPEAKVLDAMRKAGFQVDSTLAPGLQYDNGITYYDFKPMAPFQVAYPIADSIQQENEAGQLYEMPIFTCRTNPLRNLYHLLLTQWYRLSKRPEGCTGDTIMPATATYQQSKWRSLWEILRKQYLMLDLSGKVPAEAIIYGIRQALQQLPHQKSPIALPLIAICHTKNFGNPREWERLFSWVERHEEVVLDSTDVVPVFREAEQIYKTMI